ncbi:MAG: PAS domain S-box protein [Verrucomicrobiae bacterium]|nr:PAS domain S-box protein [Verrucomicrobiae bacterium]
MRQGMFNAESEGGSAPLSLAPAAGGMDSIEYLSAIFQQSLIGVAVVEVATGRYLQANARFAEIVGYPLPELLQRTFQSITHPDDLAQGTRLREALLQGRIREYHFQKRYVRADGGVVWGSVAISAVGAPGEPCRRALVFLTDITDAKRVELALQASEQQYRELVEGVNSIILRMNPEGKITFVNAFGEQFFGWPRQELTGQNVVGTIVPERECTGRDLRELLAAIAHHPEAFEHNINENMCRDGRRVWIEWLNRAVVDKDGRLVEVLCVGHDITARWEAERALQERHRQFSQLAEAARQLHRHLEVPAILRLLVQTAVSLTGASGGAAGRLEGGKMVFKEYYAGGRWVPIDYQFPEGYGVPGLVMQTRQPYVSAHAPTDPHVIPEIQQALGLVTLADVPIFSHQGELLGCIEIHNKQGGQPFNEVDVELLQILAATAGIALHNAQLYQWTQQELAERRRMDAVLREQERRLKESQRIARIGSWHWDLVSGQLSWSEETYRLYGVSPDTFTLKLESFLQLIHPEDRAAMQQWVEDCMQGCRPGDLEFRAVLPDGSVRWLNGRGERVCDVEGRPLIMHGTVQDITERKRVEAALRESEERYRALFERSMDAVFLCDFEGRFLDANQAALDLLGYAREDIQSLEFHHLLTPEQLPLAFRTVREVLETGRQQTPTEYVLRRKDGRTIMMETHAALIYMDGRPWAIQGIGRDITARRQAEQAEREARQFLQTILDTVPARVFWKDRQSRYLGCNLAFARDAQVASPAEIAGKTDYDLVWKERAAQYQAVDQEVIDSGQPRLRYELAITHPDRTQSWLIVSKTPLRNAQGEIIGVLGIYEDITELKQMQEAHDRLQQQLLHAQKLESVGRLAGGVAHDFNNMLQAILGNVELAMQEAGLPPEVTESLDEIKKSAERSAKLTQQLLGYARKQTIMPRRLDLNEEIGQLLLMLQRLIGEHIKLVWAPGPGLGWVWLDPGQLNQVLANLVVNAKDAIGERAGGQITIETARVVLDEAYVAQHAGVTPGEYVMVAVSDNGVGMSAQVKARLFEPFFTTKELGKGTGLGLATVYGIMQQNGGQVNVYSEEGQGTTFKLYFPCLAGELTRPEESGEVRPAENGMPGARGEEVVLLVEDEEQVLELERRLLERRGYRVLAACGPEEALAQAGRITGRLDLLITDVVMPGMNGRELRDRLRQRWPRLKCLFMSGYTANVIAHHGVLEEGVDFIPKPFSAVDFCRKIRATLDAENRDD